MKPFVPPANQSYRRTGGKSRRISQEGDRRQRLGACLMTDSTAGGQPDGVSRAKAIQLFSAAPAAFIENTGEIDDPSIRYAFYGSGANVFHTANGPMFQVFQRELDPQTVTPQPFADPRHPVAGDQSLTATCSFSATFPGANKIDPIGDQPQDARMNYYIGKDPSRWRPNVPTCTKVIYPGVWDGIDLHTFGRRSSLKYEFHAAPGADWSKIAVRYFGILGLQADSAGALRSSMTALASAICWLLSFSTPARSLSRSILCRSAG